MSFSPASWAPWARAPVEGVPDDLVQLADEILLEAQVDFETEAWKQAGALLAGQTTRSEAVASLTPKYATMRAVMTLQLAVSSWPSSPWTSPGSNSIC